MSGGFPPMDDYGNISPMEQVFRDPVYSDARRSRQMDRDDIPPRMSSMDVGGNTYINRKPSLARRQSTSRRPSLKRTSTNSGITLPVDYELWRFEKIGEDWTEANRDFIPAPQKNLAKKAKTSGKVLDQMQTMVHTRRAQVNDLLEKKYKQTGFRYEPAYLEEVDAGTNRSSGKKEVRVFDIIVARAGLNGAARPSFSKSRPLSISSGRGETVRLPKNTEKDTYGDKKDKREKDVGSNKHGGKKDIKDPDPHGTSKLFAPSGKPLDLDNEAPVPFDEVDLPPHIKEDEPIGRIVPTKRRGKSRGGKSQRGDDPDEIVQVLDDDGAFRDGGAAQVLDTMVYDNILPKGKNKKGKAGRSRSRSKTPARRSKSTSRARAHAEHRGKRGERVERYMHDDHSSDSSDNGSGRSMFMMDGEDDDTSFTSSGVHRDMAERGSLHRRSSSKRSDLPFREHYRGPERDRGSKYVGEQIMIPERPIRRLSSTYYPKQQKAIGYGDDYISGPTSPRRYGVPELLYPSEIRQEDQRSERYVDGYMQEDRIYDLKQRELDERERALERKERDLRRISQGTRYVPRDSYHR